MTRILTILLAGAALALLPGDVAPAGCRHVAVHHQKQAAVVFAPQYGNGYLYQVGAPLQYRAMIEQAKAELRAEAQALQAAPTPETLPITAEIDRWALVKKNCQSCHLTNESAEESVDMSSLADLSCETKLAMAAAILDSKMPPKKQLDPSVIGNLLGEIVGAETVEH